MRLRRERPTKLLGERPACQGRIGTRSLWLHKAPPLMKDLAQQLRRPKAWKPTHLSPLVSFDPVRPPASRPLEGAERRRGGAG
jgi:hypothetical protein